VVHVNVTEDPADTRMMGIVHEALKRDLRRVREVLVASPVPRGRQRESLGGHVTWMLDFLHAHHSSEDAGLWPLVRRRNPAAAPLLDSMEADHAGIAVAADVTAAAAREYTTTTSDAARVALVDALDGLLQVLVPHLDREVAEAMPVVAASITNREWDEVEQEYNIKPKKTRQLAMEGHWLLEDIDPEGYGVVVHKVSSVQRFVLLHGFGRAYRRGARARWVPDVAAVRRSS
jgi:hemerythrin-like domain-containing protein